MDLKEINKKIIDKINRDWEWDFGISFTDALEKFNNNKFVIKIKQVFITIFAVLTGLALGGSLCILFLAHPILVTILIIFDLMLVIIAYYEYNGLMEGVKQCLTDIMKNVQLKKIKN